MSTTAAGKNLLLETLYNLALDDDDVEEHAKDVPLPSKVAAYFREHNDRRKSGQIAATTNLAALHQIIAESKRQSKEGSRAVRDQQRPINVAAGQDVAPTGSAAFQAMSSDLGENIQWENELNQAVLDDIAASIRRLKDVPSPPSLQATDQDETSEDEDPDWKVQPNNSLRRFVKRMSQELHQEVQVEATTSMARRLSRQLSDRLVSEL